MIEKMDNYTIMPIKKEWFDKLLSGEKTIEYRENKRYWWDRLKLHETIDNGNHLEVISYNRNILFRNGYRKDSRKAFAEIQKVQILKNGIDTDLRCSCGVIAIHIKTIKEI